MPSGHAASFLQNAFSAIANPNGCAFLQNAFSAITNPDGCAWDEAELVHGKGNSFSAGCRFWAVLEAAGLKAFRKEVSSRSHLSESPVGMKHGDFAARTKSTRSRSIIFIKTSPSLL